ncbi:MAG: ABC transporter ATP-binding protein [Candidatus Bipolaricaulia bacterium]
MEELLRTDNLTRDFGGLRAVSQVNLTIKKGDIIGLVGPNGAGKTTLFNLISGFISPTSGAVYFEGKNISSWPVHKRVEAGITRTFQGSRVFPGLTVRDNVITATYSAGDKGTFTAIREEGEELNTEGDSPVEWVLNVTELQKYSDFLAQNLSYGYSRRLELAIAIATNPKLLLLDEPFSGTHSYDLRELAELLRFLNSEGLTVVLVEHNIASVANVADRLVYMESGRITIPNGRTAKS